MLAVLDQRVFVLGQIRKALVDPDEDTYPPESLASLAESLGLQPNLGLTNIPAARSPLVGTRLQRHSQISADTEQLLAQPSSKRKMDGAGRCRRSQRNWPDCRCTQPPHTELTEPRVAWAAAAHEAQLVSCLSHGSVRIAAAHIQQKQ